MTTNNENKKIAFDNLEELENFLETVKTECVEYESIKKLLKNVRDKMTSQMTLFASGTVQELLKFYETVYKKIYNNTPSLFI